MEVASGLPPADHRNNALLHDAVAPVSAPVRRNRPNSASLAAQRSLRVHGAGGGNVRVLVTGGRDYDDAELVFRTLDQIHIDTPITLIIEGACPTGADAHARAWAALRKIRN